MSNDPILPANHLPKIPAVLQSVDPSIQRKFWVVIDEHAHRWSGVFMDAGAACASARTKAQLNPLWVVYVMECVQAYKNEGERVIEITMTKDVETPKP